MYIILFKEYGRVYETVRYAETMEDVRNQVDSIIRSSVENGDEKPPQFYGVFTENCYSTASFNKLWAQEKTIYDTLRHGHLIEMARKEMAEKIAYADDIISKSSWYQQEVDDVFIGDIVELSSKPGRKWKILDISGNDVRVCVLEEVETKTIITEYAAEIADVFKEAK